MEWILGWIWSMVDGWKERVHRVTSSLGQVDCLSPGEYWLMRGLTGHGLKRAFMSYTCNELGHPM